jgi:ribonucleoside-diphosphate reductase alpha chain
MSEILTEDKKTKRYYWLNDESRTFLSRGYLEESAEQRISNIAHTAEKILKIEGFANKFEEYMSRGFYSLSTPVWVNFGKNRGLPISCYGSNIDDSMDSILNAGREIGLMSKYGGGTSAYLGNIRPRGSKISTGGAADGPVHYARLYDTVIDVSKQSEARRGACAVWLPIEHDDISDFLDIGSEGNPIQNLQFGVTITDKWLEEMKNGDAKKRKIWAKVIQRRSEFGFPYIMFKDNTNNNSPYKDLGLEITASNLCLTADQRVVTSKGYLTVQELYESGEDLTLFDGEKAVSSTPMILRDSDSEILKITFDNGMSQKVTPNHGMALMNDDRGKIERVEAKDLKIGDYIAIQTNKGLFGELDMQDEAYLLGLYQSDGTQNKDLIMLDVWENDFDLIDDIQDKFNNIHYKYKCDTYQTMNNFSKKECTINRPPAQFFECKTGQSKVRKKRLTAKTLKKSLNFEKGYVPSWIWESNEETIWAYLKGLLYADGTAFLSNSDGNPIQIAYADINKGFLEELQILFTNLGISCSIKMLRKSGKNFLPDGKGGYKYYDTKDCWRLIFSSKNDALLIEEKTSFLSRKGIKLEEREYRDNTKKRTKVVSIQTLENEPVYCPTVHSDEHIFVSNGVKTFNCSEIQLPTDSFHSFVCCLGSINLLHWDEIEKTDAIETYTLFLNAVMDEFIFKSYNMPGMKRAWRFASEHRAIGLGVLGYHSMLQSKRIPFESIKTKQYNERIFKILKERSDETSKKLYETNPQKYKCIRPGFANSTLIAIAPTKSSSFILGQVSMGIEPIKSNYFIKDLAKIKTIYKNPYLTEELEKYGMNTNEIWDSILKKDGSVQHLDFPTKEVFKTFLEISPKEIVLQAAQRQKYIDQSQSLNLMIHPSISAKDINQLYLYAHEEGVKTLYYQFSQNSAQVFSRNILECVNCEA